MNALNSIVTGKTILINSATLVLSSSLKFLRIRPFENGFSHHARISAGALRGEHGTLSTSQLRPSTQADVVPIAMALEVEHPFANST